MAIFNIKYINKLNESSGNLSYEDMIKNNKHIIDSAIRRASTDVFDIDIKNSNYSNKIKHRLGWTIAKDHDSKYYKILLGGYYNTDDAAWFYYQDKLKDRLNNDYRLRDLNIKFSTGMDRGIYIEY